MRSALSVILPAAVFLGTLAANLVVKPRAPDALSGSVGAVVMAALYSAVFWYFVIYGVLSLTRSPLAWKVGAGLGLPPLLVLAAIPILKGRYAMFEGWGGAAWVAAVGAITPGILVIRLVGGQQLWFG